MWCSSRGGWRRGSERTSRFTGLSTPKEIGKYSTGWTITHKNCTFINDSSVRAPVMVHLANVCFLLKMIALFMRDTLIHTTDTTQAYTPSWWVACPSWSCVRVSRPWSAPASWLPRQPPEPYSLHPERERERRRRRRRRKQSTESVSKEEELVNRWLLAGELAQMIEGSEDKYEEGSCMTEGEVNGREERIKRDSSVPDPHFLMLRGKPSLFSLPIHLVWDPFYIACIRSRKIFLL